MDYTISIFGTLFCAATAIATCITAKAEKSTLRLASSSQCEQKLAEIREIINENKTSQSIDYILSDKYYRDLRCVLFYLGKNNSGNIDDIGLKDFDIILTQLKNPTFIKKFEQKKIIEKDRERLRKSLKKIQYILDNMNHIGYLASDDKHRDDLINYFKTITAIDIVKTYERLYPLIKKTREDLHSNEKFQYFSLLYDFIKHKTSTK